MNALARSVPVLCFVAAAIVLVGLPPLWPSGGKPAVAKPLATAAVYVYEKSDGPVPNAVSVGLNRLNRERKILATMFEADTTDGEGNVPDQYAAANAAAKVAGIPSLIVLSGTTAIVIVKAPKTAEEVVGAVP